MDKVKIEQRITELTTERARLKDAHTELVQQNQRVNQDFQQRIVQNQTRYAQLTGAIDELKHMTNGQTPPSTENQPQEKTTP
jgi:seryl-tRNA synthetase